MASFIDQHWKNGESPMNEKLDSGNNTSDEGNSPSTGTP